MVFSKIMRKTAEIGGIQSIKSYSVSCDGERQKKTIEIVCVCVFVLNKITLTQAFSFEYQDFQSDSTHM